MSNGAVLQIIRQDESLIDQGGITLTDNAVMQIAQDVILRTGSLKVTVSSSILGADTRGDTSRVPSVTLSCTTLYVNAQSDISNLQNLVRPSPPPPTAHTLPPCASPPCAVRLAVLRHPAPSPLTCMPQPPVH